jgi:arylsulfatase A
MNTLIKLFAALAVCLGLACCSFAAGPTRPNVVLFMVDDFGYECITANGGQSYQTPHVDQLAASGVRFENCHVQPLCTPTRVQLMTGQYNVRNYLKFGTLMRSETTFGQLFKSAGYRTGICGKWQLGRDVDSPQHFGFEESCLWQQTRRPPRYANPGLEYNGVERDFDSGEYGPTLVNDFALDFIDRHCDEAFFLYYPMILTHDPFQPTPDADDWDPTTKSEAIQRNLRHFADMTAWMDKMVGRVVSKLAECNVRENTLLIFIGDNGTHSSVTSEFQGKSFQGGKGRTTHRGTHVPCVVNWPAQIRQPAVLPDLVSSVDFLPTICEAAGIEIPDDLDGVSFLPRLKGQAGSPRKWLYSWYSPRQRADLTVKECAFDHNYKLYRSGKFFDLNADPDEQNPLSVAELSGDAATAAKQLQSALDRFADARPAELDQQFLASAGSLKPGKKNQNRNRNKPQQKSK